MNEKRKEGCKMKLTEDLVNFLTISQSLIGVNLLLTDMEKSIIEIDRDGQKDLSQREISKELKEFRITETVIKNGPEEIIKLFKTPVTVNTQLISPIMHNGIQVGFLVYYYSEGAFDEKHAEFAATGRDFVEKFVEKYSETL